jgi:uncharacterized membrane protein
MNQKDAFRLAEVLFVIGAAMIIYVSYPTYTAAGVFLIGLIVLLIGVYLFLAHIRIPSLPGNPPN